MTETALVPLSGTIRDSIDGLVKEANTTSGRDPNTRGVFSSYPFMTPKYMRHRGSRKNEYTETMARMFIEVGAEDYSVFLESLEDLETREIAKVLAGVGTAGSDGGVGYIDFLLQQASHQLTEKMQVVETLADNYVAFFFGTSAPVWSYQGMLMNTYQDNWTMRMYKIFRDLARGTQLARNGLLLSLKYDSLIVSGAMVNLRWNLVAGTESACQFSFDLLIKTVSVIYGGYAPPTELKAYGETTFAPEGFSLAAAASSGAVMSTYMHDVPQSEAPKPQGVSPSNTEAGNAAAPGAETAAAAPAAGTPPSGSAAPTASSANSTSATGTPDASVAVVPSEAGVTNQPLEERAAVPASTVKEDGTVVITQETLIVASAPGVTLPPGTPGSSSSRKNRNKTKDKVAVVAPTPPPGPNNYQSIANSNSYTGFPPPTQGFTDNSALITYNSDLAKLTEQRDKLRRNEADFAAAASYGTGPLTPSQLSNAAAAAEFGNRADALDRAISNMGRMDAAAYAQASSR